MDGVSLAADAATAKHAARPPAEKTAPAEAGAVKEIL